jgi:phospholipase C
MANPQFPLIQNVFVLMLENHSFDHLLGFSGITGIDAETGNATIVNGLTGNESNTYLGVPYGVGRPAGFSMPIDPGHEFTDTLLQLTGSGQAYDPALGYPTINNSGFVNDYVTSLSPDEGKASGDFGEIMKCFSQGQLPVLNALCRAFAVCDQWHSSMPGPTWPNRFFVHAASSGGLDHSPTTAEILAWQTLGGVNFENGTLFDQLRAGFDDGYRLYRGNNFLSDDFPNVAALKGISSLDVHPFNNFASDVNAPGYDALYTFIEPSYGDVLNNTYKGGTSQHPLDDAAGGEQLIKETYEAIRNSPLWPKSLLIVTWDEHGGFYDHVAPPAAVPPGDRTIQPGMNAYGFDFKQYGVRVPAVIVSPLIPRGIIDHRLYDHSSVSRTLQDLFSLKPMTARDKNANSLLPLLLMLQQPRTDAPLTLPEPEHTPAAALVASVSNVPIPANHGSLPGFLHAALRTDLQISPPEQHPEINERFSQIRTQQDARNYMSTVQAKVAVYQAGA